MHKGVLHIAGRKQNSHVWQAFARQACHLGSQVRDLAVHAQLLGAQRRDLGQAETGIRQRRARRARGHRRRGLGHRAGQQVHPARLARAGRPRQLHDEGGLVRRELVEEALDAATDGDLDPFHKLISAVTNPFEEQLSLVRYAHPAPEDFGPYRTFCGT